ncbi:hypothetical protein P872_15465 [Rhodonellum psychrophilum GCM71 = DSM 17998]|uniref:Uncharacterized protein n=2 Tax=Rhodonellum TaxID=336827 RepID=U5BU68_9BACT|nr:MULTISPECIES: tetratricopeptide repeat protein [Rhodonellum]ERM84180.1 hypothetical protein P872_15465 [Rhodonellum psychrophilum GCM71 = DSM 17998]SDZ19498.1 DNA-binding transcriptional regulator, CsgD family [Rhodonellum ikkaensis]
MNFCLLRGLFGVVLVLWCFLVEGAEDQLKNASVQRLLMQAKTKMFLAPDSSYYFATEALKVSGESDDKLTEGLILQFLGEILFQQGIYAESGERFLAAADIFKAFGSANYLVENYNFQGRILYKTKNAKISLEMHQLAYELAIDCGDLIGQAKSLGWIGSMHEKSGDYPKALYYQWKSLGVFRRQEMGYLSSQIMENLGSIYEDSENFDSALFYFDAAYQLNLQTGDSLKLISNINNLGDIYRKQGRLEEALTNSLMALQISRLYNDIYQESSALRDISKIYKDKEDFKTSLSYLDTSRMVYQEIFSLESARQLALMEQLSHVKLKDQQISELKYSQVLDKKLKFLLVLLTLLVLGLSLVFYSRQKIKSKSAEELLFHQKKNLYHQQKLMEKEVYHVQLKEQKMADELELNSKSLLAQTLHLIDKNKILEEIRKKLQQTVEDDSKEQKKKIRNLIKMIDFNFVQDTDWDSFRKNFEKVHENFFHQLNGFSQHLTPSDLRLASLMRLNMSSKDIASILGISPESLRISRYRLRKKLNLPKGESLQQFILGI